MHTHRKTGAAEVIFAEANMTTIRAIIRNGRIEVDEPIDLPDRTELAMMNACR